MSGTLSFYRFRHCIIVQCQALYHCTVPGTVSFYSVRHCKMSGATSERDSAFYSPAAALNKTWAGLPAHPARAAGPRPHRHRHRHRHRHTDTDTNTHRHTDTQTHRHIHAHQARAAGPRPTSPVRGPGRPPPAPLRRAGAGGGQTRKSREISELLASRSVAFGVSMMSLGMKGE